MRKALLIAALALAWSSCCWGAPSELPPLDLSYTDIDIPRLFAQIVGIYHVGVLDYAGYPDTSIGLPATGYGRVYYSTTDNTLHCKTAANASCISTGSGTTITIANGTAALATAAITSGTCATVVTSAATGVATTDNIMADFNADPTGVTGYSPSASGMLTIIKYPTLNTANFKVCNNTAGDITPGAITLNWRVVR